MWRALHLLPVTNDRKENTFFTYSYPLPFFAPLKYPKVKTKHFMCMYKMCGWWNIQRDELLLNCTTKCAGHNTLLQIIRYARKRVEQQKGRRGNKIRRRWNWTLQFVNRTFYYISINLMHVKLLLESEMLWLASMWFTSLSICLCLPCAVWLYITRRFSTNQLTKTKFHEHLKNDNSFFRRLKKCVSSFCS